MKAILVDDFIVVDGERIAPMTVKGKIEVEATEAVAVGD